MGLSQSLNNYSNRMGQSTVAVSTDKKMASSGLLLSSNHKRLPSIRTKQPMPEPNELEQRFTKILASMDLPPDKAKLLKNYDREKKWDIICDQEMVHAKDPPSYYLNKLRTYLDPKASRSHRKRKMVLDSTSTQVLRDLEISLRTNNIEWVREFLSDENRGLDVLVDYLNFRLMMMRQEHRIRTANSEESILSYSHNSASKHNNNGGNNLVQNSHRFQTNQHQYQPQHQQQPYDNQQQQHKSYQESQNQSDSLSYAPINGSSTITKAQINDFSTNSDSPTARRRSKHVAKLNMGEAQDDIHLCILCLRAIMNNKYGYNRVISHQEAINYIALSLIHKSLRTKALVLELLAAVCLVKGGHAIIIAAFDNFKEVFHERHRFQTLMDYFINYEVFHIEFMVACMQFVNIVVHSVNDLNFRVHLQYEFTILGLDDYLKKLRLTESDQLQTQISAFYDNVFDVSALMDDSETKTAALEKVAELEDELGQAHERISEIEREALAKLANLETELSMIKQERDELLESRRQTDELMSTLKRAELESKKRQSILESKILELETMTKSLPNGTSNISHNSSTKSVINGILPEESNKNDRNIVTSASVAMPPPPPPPPLPFKDTQKSTMSMTAPMVIKHANNFIPSVPTPPPPAGFMQAPDGSMTIKRKVQTKYKLPTLNWIAMKPNQVRGTIFNELDDDKLHNTIDFNDFEERFKIGINGVVCSEDVDGLSTFPSKRFKKPENVTLLEHTRLRNIAISRRKLDMPVDKVIVAINSLDLRLLSLENVELLQRMVPTDQEVKAYREYVCEKKNVNLLTEEDKFLLQLTRVERISTKLAVMSYIGNFFENLHLISPQVHAIISAASSVKNSKKLRSILEIILAFGNYMNSSKRGPAYGFKLQSLDTLMDTKSSDKRMCLMHYIAATVRQKFPELLSFDLELLYIEKAALVSMENLVTDIQELEKGMDQVRKEFDLRSKSGQNFVLRDFLVNSEDKFRRLKIDIRSAQDSFRECVEYFGESPRSTDANTFFALLVRFAKSFKLADTENEQRRRLELAAIKNQNKVDEDTIRMNKLNQKKQQEAVINELKHRTKSVQEKKLLHQDEVYNGALEDILLGLKSEPYRRADAVRRSQRRKIDSNRLSKSIDEYDL